MAYWLVDHYIRSNMLTGLVCPRRRLYTLEKGMSSGGIALGAFLDIEGAFNNTTFDSISEAAESFGIDGSIVRWIRAMLESRVIISSIGMTEMSSSVTRGCPQGGVLSPLLWCLVLDGLLPTLNLEKT
uniref:Reverse transcriptase domain-containing protein n=1 Tax=Photinus pyralis TaxID=7054 RepID=A0A1Y1MHF7_PHOPY